MGWLFVKFAYNIVFISWYFILFFACFTVFCYDFLSQEYKVLPTALIRNQDWFLQKLQNEMLVYSTTLTPCSHENLMFTCSIVLWNISTHRALHKCIATMEVISRSHDLPWFHLSSSLFVFLMFFAFFIQIKYISMLL